MVSLSNHARCDLCALYVQRFCHERDADAVVGVLGRPADCDPGSPGARSLTPRKLPGCVAHALRRSFRAALQPARPDQCDQRETLSLAWIHRATAEEGENAGGEHRTGDPYYWGG